MTYTHSHDGKTHSHLISKESVKTYFDNAAEQWDNNLKKNDDIIRTIIGCAGVGEGMQVLDVACGTGVMFDFYLERNVAGITGVDISDKMIDVARKKYRKHDNITLLALDVEYLVSDKGYDVCMIYNAFPHFPDHHRLIKTMYDLTRTGGRLCVAHGASKAEIDARHHGSAQHISLGLISVEEMAELFEPYFDVDVMISDDEKYIVCGVRK
ncbi:MAG: methyltransferase domain-containing protein [Anaerofustis stercorihominis]|nr:methyltransferase domain-containing protein [Anaerofustis stercorihominis]